MSNDAIGDYSLTATDNTDIGGIGIQGTNAVSNFDNALRVLLSQLRAEHDAVFALSRGDRNRLINPAGLINQRGYVSGTATTAANQYTLDRWRVVVSGQALSWADANGVRTLTAPAGGLEQVIEADNLAPGDYTLSWVGTATATVDGAAVANGGKVTLAGGANSTIRFVGGTVSQPQFERSATKTAFERRMNAIEVALCQRYFCVFDAIASGAYPQGGQNAQAASRCEFPVTMRTTPTIVIGALNASNAASATFGNTTPRGTTLSVVQNTAIGQFAASITGSTASAEL